MIESNLPNSKTQMTTKLLLIQPYKYYKYFLTQYIVFIPTSKITINNGVNNYAKTLINKPQFFNIKIQLYVNKL